MDLLGVFRRLALGEEVPVRVEQLGSAVFLLLTVDFSMNVSFALFALWWLSMGFASATCSPEVTILRAGQPVSVRDSVVGATLTPLWRNGEVYLPIRYVGSVLKQSVSVDPIWNTFTIEGTTFRVGERESHQPAPTLGGVQVTSVQRYEVAPLVKANRIYIPLSMLPWLRTQRSSDDTTRVLPSPGNCLN